MYNNLKIFSGPEQLAKGFAAFMAKEIIESADNNKPFSIALSGGSTPKELFSELAKVYAESLPWDKIQLFWVDERCVAPDHNESNYGILIPPHNIHRIKGEADPETEVIRYKDEIMGSIEKKNGLPRFDLVILGLGEDGHTASIFPDKLELFNSDKICTVAIHPVSKLKRITITGPVLNNSRKIAFLVSGSGKARKVAAIIENKKHSIKYPASHISPADGELLWYTDEEAASLIG